MIDICRFLIYWTDLLHRVIPELVIFLLLQAVPVLVDVLQLIQ